jgi:hypothetical protein
MFAAVKVILALVIACGSLIAVMVESAHPGFVACFCVAFAVGAIAGEVVRIRRAQTVRTRRERRAPGTAKAGLTDPPLAHTGGVARDPDPGSPRVTLVRHTVG